VIEVGAKMRDTWTNAKNAKAPASAKTLAYAIVRGQAGQPTMRTTRRGAGGWSLAAHRVSFIFGVTEFYLSAASVAGRLMRLYK
jgi:hypothetical protein